MSEPVCKTCNDTHLMWMESLEREVACTRCPRPCARCVRGAYCATTPCACACHKPAPPPAEAKHTPGPWHWRVNRKSHGVSLVARDGMGSIVMDFARFGTQGAQPRFPVGHMRTAAELAVDIAGQEHNNAWNQTLDHANARLIAAAPDLLAALERLLAVGDDDERIKASAQARAAIAAAKGGAR